MPVIKSSENGIKSRSSTLFSRRCSECFGSLFDWEDEETACGDWKNEISRWRRQRQRRKQGRQAKHQKKKQVTGNFDLTG